MIIPAVFIKKAWTEWRFHSFSNYLSDKPDEVGSHINILRCIFNFNLEKKTHKFALKNTLKINKFKKPQKLRSGGTRRVSFFFRTHTTRHRVGATGLRTGCTALSRRSSSACYCGSPDL